VYGEEDQQQPIPLGVRIFWIIVFTAGGIILAAWLLKGSQDKYVIIQTFVLTLTLISVTWYAVLTLRMQRAIVRQTNLSVLPIFILRIGDVQSEIRGSKRMLDELELENIGNGVALNVHIDDVDVDVGYQAPTLGIKEPNITFDTAVSIGKNERIVIRHTSWLDRSRAEDKNCTNFLDFIRHLTPLRASKDYEIKVRFMDIMGNKYVQIVHVGKSGIWSDVVEPDDRAVGFQPYETNDNPFTSSPLKYLRRRIPPRR